MNLSAMRRFNYITIFLACWSLVATGWSQVHDRTKRGGYFEVKSKHCLSSSQRQQIKEAIHTNVLKLEMLNILTPVSTRDRVVLDWPLQPIASFSDYAYHGISNFVDHNPDFPNHILDYHCGERSYDTEAGYNHAGTDFFLWPFGWKLMEEEVIEVVATAPGVIVGKDDGEFDQNCDITVEASWNAIYIQHEDGSQTWYGHLKRNSLTSKDVGESVERGEYLGLVGSSGISSGPHLHLELYDDAGNLVDPFQGECSEEVESWWSTQRPYYDSGLNKLSTHTAPPEWTDCAELMETNASNDFCPGDTVYFMTFLRDQLAGQVLRYQVFDQEGALYTEWIDALENVAHYSASYWYFPIVLSEEVEEGLWTFQVEYLNEFYTHHFNVCKLVKTPDIPLQLMENGLFPNPVATHLSVHIEIFKANKYVFDVRDVNGRVLTKSVHELVVGQHLLDFDLNILASGLYLLAVSDKKGALVAKRFVKK